MAPGPHPHRAAGFPATLVADVLEDALTPATCVYGIAGLQGSGKSTLAAQVQALAARRGLRVATVSIDDFYLDRDARAALARSVHPLMATRGPPGSHDLDLACATLDALCAGASVALPRFDKIDDMRRPRADWPMSGVVDLVLIDGWFLRTPPQHAAELNAPLNALERDEDANGTWRHHANKALQNDCPRLWQRIDRMLFLQGPGFEVVPAWRWEQECALAAANPGRATMSRAAVGRFVHFFERTSRQALRTLPALAERTIVLDAGRRVVAPAG